MVHHPIRLRNLIPSPVISLVVLALVVVFLAPATEQAQAATPLSLTGFSPTAGPVGTVVTLTGTGFVSGDIVAIAGKAASSSTANSAGTKLTIRVPALATTGPITVQDPRTGQVVGLPGTLFRVTRGLYLSPSKVWPGGKTVLSGSGLTPDAVEKILLGTQLLTSVRTDAGGGFQAIISVPWDANTGFNRFGVLDRQGPIYVIVQILASWPAFRHDAAHSGYDSFETALTPSTVSGLKAKFNRGTFNSITSSPAVADNAVYVGSGDGNVYAWNATTGAALWTFNTGAAVDSSPTVSNGIVYVGSNNGQLYALNASTGVKIWSFTVGGPVDSPAVAYGFVYAASDFGNVFAVNATTGAKEWRFPAGSAVNSSPAVANGLLYVGSDSGKVFALDAGEGALVWSYQTGGVIESSPSVTSKALYIGSDDGKVYALNATTGSKLGSFATGLPITSSPAFDGPDNTVYFGASSISYLYAVNATTGVEKWKQALTLPSVHSSPAVANGVVYVGSEGNFYLYAVNALTGAILWNQPIGGFVDSSPAVANGIVYVGSGDGYLYAFGL